MSKSVNIATREKILQAAEEVFSEHGFHEALVEDIANKAGLGKGTVYLYFKNKEELFKSLIFEKIDKAKTVGLTEVNNYETEIEKLKFCIRSHFEFFKEHKRLFSILVSEQVGVGCGEIECHQKLIEHINLMEAIINEGIEKGIFKKIDSKLLSYAIVGIVTEIIRWTTFNKEFHKLEDLEPIYELIFKGILKE